MSQHPLLPLPQAGEGGEKRRERAGFNRAVLRPGAVFGVQTLAPSQEATVGWRILTDGFFASTVGKHGDETIRSKYVKNQGNEYHKSHSDHQLALF